MATTLAEQLKKLATPQTSVLLRDKKRASLLFDSSVAAGIDRDTFYDIGISGLTELEVHNNDFSSFRSTLFSPHSKNFQRAVETKESNQKLDKNIQKFLVMVSPYFLLKPAQKALEWLINRYSIHEYNIDDFLMLILPYHETNIFVKCLQLMNLKNNKRWSWLSDLQRPGVHLPKINLFNQCSANVGFLKFIGEMTHRAVKESGAKASSLTTLITFYCSTTIGTLENTPKIKENHIAAILTTLLKSLSSEVPDFVASGYMIVAQLLKKATLSKDILDAFVLKICSEKQKALRMEGTLLLLLIFQSQHENYKVFPQRAVKNLLKGNWFCANVANLVLKGSYVIPLILPVLEAMMKDLEDTNRNFIEELLEKVHLGENDAYILIKTIIGICLQKTNVSNVAEYDIVDMNENSENIQEWYGQILKRLETKYPNPFDRYVQEITTGKGSNKNRNMLRWIMNQAMRTDKDSFEIFEKLYHPNPEFRANAVQHLVKKYKKLQDTDKEIFKNVISERLLDENRHVVQSVLKLNKADLFELLGENILSTFVKLLVNCTKKDWLDVAKDVTDIICNDPLVKKPEIFITILPFLFPSNSKQLTLTINILNTKFADYYIFLKKLRGKSKNTTPQQLSEIVYSTIIQVSNLPNLDLLLKTIKNIPVLLEIHKFLCLLLMTACVQENSTGCLQVITSTIEYLKIAKIVHENTENISVMTNIVFAKNKECIPLQGVLDCIKLIILRVKSPDGVDWFNLLELNEYNHFLLITFSVLLKKSFTGNKIEVSLYSNVLQVFLTKFFPEFTDQINFLSNLSILNHIDDLNIINSRFQLRVLRLIKTLLQKTKQNVSTLVDFNSPVVISNILIGLSNPIPEIRIVVMEILRILVNYISENPHNFIPLMAELLKHEEMFLLDPEQIGMILLTVKSGSMNMDKIFEHLFRIACNTKNPIYVNAYLAKVLAFINSKEILEETSKYALELLNSGENVYDYFKSTIIYKVTLRITEKLSRDITLGSNAWKFMMSAIKCDSVNLEYTEEKNKTLPVLVLEQINREFYANLNIDIQKLLLTTLIDIATTTNNPDVTQEINKIFKKIDLDAKLLTDILVAMKEVKSKKVKPIKKKTRKLQEVPTIDILDTLEWKIGVTTLEFIQDKKKITNISVLLPFLFDILQKCLAFDEQAALEYPKQIILSLLLYACEKMALDGETIPTAQFNVELVVQCVRASQNPQTHHHALILLAKAATLIPDQVLHHIMAIFTFMGSSVLRHDDAYSFQIISKIIETVIPILVQRDSEQKEFNISCVLRVFVDVILDVPVHRRKALFITLLMTLGVEQYLWLFLVLVFEAHVVHGETKSSSTSDLQTDLEISPKRLDIAANIVLEFSIEVILKTCTKLLEYLKGLPLEKDENMMNVDKCSTFDIALYTAKQFRHYKYILVNFTATLLSSKEFVNRVVVLPSEDSYKLEPLYKNMLINILNYIHVLWKINEQSTGKPQSLYWKVLLHHSYNVMDSINALLTPEMFLLVIRGLMLHNIMTVRKKALDILNQKLQHEPTFLYNESDSDPPQNEDSIFGLLSILIAMVKTVSQEEDEKDTEKELVQQTALLSLKLFIKLLASKYTEKFVNILNFITDLIKSNKVHGNMLASVVLCLAELCSKLRAHSISGLPKFMPCLIKLLKQQKQQETPNLLSMCILTTIQKIVESLPLFLSPYLEKLLIELSILATKWNESDDTQTVTVFMKKLATVRSNIGSLIPPRVLIPIVSASYDSLAEKNNYLAVGSLLNVLSENLTNLSGQDLTNLLPDLTHLFLKAFQIRADNTTLDHDTINAIEDDIIKTFNTLVLKLSETTFRPIYYRLFDWAGGNDAKTKRIITFYRISYGVAQNLKSLFVLFAGHFVKNAASLLDACNCQKTKSLYFKDTKNNTLLIESIIKTLHVVFLFDSTKFVNRERFETLMQPLVDQLENILDGNEYLKDRAQELLIPCLGQFAVAAADDVLWKQLNYQILLKTRSDVPLVRIIATEALCEVAQKLGDEFLPLLPETIPFLAELLEDEDENVEEECKKSVQKLEKVVGEPLQKYF